MTVQIEVGWDYETSLLIFKKLVNRSGILKEFKAKEFFLTRIQRRRAKDLVAVKRKRKRAIR